MPSPPKSDLPELPMGPWIKCRSNSCRRHGYAITTSTSLRRCCRASLTCSPRPTARWTVPRVARVFLAHAARRLQTIHSRHADIHDDHIGRLYACGRQSAVPAMGSPGFKAPDLEQFGQAFRRIQPVVDHQDVQMMLHLQEYPPGLLNSDIYIGIFSFMHHLFYIPAMGGASPIIERTGYADDWPWGVPDP